MFGLGLPEIVLILIVVLIFMGPKTLPAAGAALGKALREFKESLNGVAPDEKAESQKAAQTSDDAQGNG